MSEGRAGMTVGANEALARDVVERLWQAGVRTFVVCPGGRNAPLVETLEHVGQEFAEVLHFFDERSAAFFALGRARRDRSPVAVVTTSGTAAAELLPAIVEAFYEDERLIAVTADRPKRFRGTGAPQAIDQRGLFGHHVVWSADVDDAGAEWSLAGVQGPAHLNVCFDEPLLDDWRGAPFWLRQAGRGAPSPDPPSSSGTDAPIGGDAAQTDVVRAFLAAHARPLVMLGALPEPADQHAVQAFCRALGAPVLAEASSHLWGLLDPLMLQGREASAQALVREGRFDAILRIGGVPSFRLWRDLEDRVTLPLLSVSRRRWPGLTRGDMVHASMQRPLPLPEPPAPWSPDQAREAFAVDRRLAERIADLVATYPASEPAIVARLSSTIPRGSSVLLGNSLPIREWNQHATYEYRAFTIRENRGVNGIDGQLSSFLGGAERGRENWAVVGDLTALYDLAAPWALRALDGTTTRLVIVNNGGGRIFGRLFANPAFQNLHQIGFRAWANQWSIPWTDDPASAGADPAVVIELRPDEGDTTAFWAAWRGLRP